MRKYLERTDTKSCFNKAADDELIFVLRGHDVCAPGTIREWVRLRLAAGKNAPSDPQIREALECADRMDEERQTAVTSAPLTAEQADT